MHHSFLQEAQGLTSRQNHFLFASTLLHLFSFSFLLNLTFYFIIMPTEQEDDNLPFGGLSVSDEQHGSSFLLSRQCVCCLKPPPPTESPFTFIASVELKPTSQQLGHALVIVQTVPAWQQTASLQTRWHVTRTISNQSNSRDNTTPCTRVPSVHAWCNEGYFSSLTPPSSPSSRFRKAFCHCLEYLRILWHDMKFCRAVWSCNAVDMVNTRVCRQSSVGFIRVLVALLTFLTLPVACVELY